MRRRLYQAFCIAVALAYLAFAAACFLAVLVAVLPE